MLARSSLLALTALTGCDFVFGVNGQPEPCPLASFETATPTPIVEADEFSVDWDQTFAVISQAGFNWEVDLATRVQTQIDLGVYNNFTFALAPEGTSLFYTAAIEPQVLKGALRGADTWKLDAAVPRGTFAGTPSADVFGPRHVLVRLRASDPAVQEYEDDGGTWVAIGEPRMLFGPTAPNLTPNGLTMVYAGFDEAGAPGVFAATRDSIDDNFGEPMLLRAGALRAPQLCGKCEQLYAVDNSSMVRFDR